MSRRHRRGGVFLVLGLAALLGAAAGIFWRISRSTPAVTLTAENLGTTRAAVAEALLKVVASRGLSTRLVEVRGMPDAIEAVESGKVDFALVSAALPIEEHPRIREVCPLYVEVLHLLVKEEIADEMGGSLSSLRGRRVDTGPAGSATTRLARAVLEFAGLASEAGPGPPAAASEEHDSRELLERIDRGNREALPDAIFRLETLPSKVVLGIVRKGRYRLVPLPFADAFRLSGLLAEGLATGSLDGIAREYVTDAWIPPFTYGIEPPTPGAPLRTVGTRLLLVTNVDTPAPAVEALLDAVFDSRFARVADPPLERSVLTHPTRIPRHPAAIAYLERDAPLFTRKALGALSTTLSILGTVVAGILFLLRWWREREEAAVEEILESFVHRTASIEHRAAQLELQPTPDLESLLALQRDLIELKSDALVRFSAGDLGRRSALSELLAPIHRAERHIVNLLLHFRSNA